MPPRTLRAFPQIDPDHMPVDPHSRSKTGTSARPLFTGKRLNDKLALALVDARVLPFKELLESFEVFEHIRRRVRAAQVVDLCCGHGLVGMLYGIHHRDVDAIRLVDRRRPDSVDRILDALDPVAPWLRPKVTFEACTIERVQIDTPAAILGIHACGTATDAVLDQAISGRHPVAVLPCCHPKRTLPGPPTLGAALGVGLATDVHRTYRLHEAGYATRWSSLPSPITPMNRVIVGWPTPDKA
ncbi:MAG: hypothetical protein CL927_04680 [Deltaproteobacteria bacterium]|nr:hypothetical protein [Deltaproteobacteria bacterium]HCH66391.1 hypothetical protein [Deltaproteobacteria bacterium]